jgi:hypothetical protein
MERWLLKLKAMGIIDETLDWARTYASPTELWGTCDYGSFMFDVVCRVDRTMPWSTERAPLLMCAIQIAEITVNICDSKSAKWCSEAHQMWAISNSPNARQGWRKRCIEARNAAEAAAEDRSIADAAAVEAARVVSLDRPEFADPAIAAPIGVSASIVRRHYPRCPLAVA